MYKSTQCITFTSNVSSNTRNKISKIQNINREEIFIFKNLNVKYKSVNVNYTHRNI